MTTDSKKIQRAIGIDLGGTNLRAAAIALSPTSAHVIKEEKQALKSMAPSDVVAQIADIIAAVSVFQSDDTTPLPVGMGVAGILDPTRQIILNAPNLNWRNVPLVALLKRNAGISVHLENDLKAITWGEFRFGAGMPYRDLLCCFIGTGVGAGAVYDGKLYRGSGNAALEIGHILVRPNGRQCGCGAVGCLEAYAGGRHLVERARALSGPESISCTNTPLHPGLVDEAAQNGNLAAAQIIDEAGTFLGHALSTAVTLFNPQAVIVGGTVWGGCPTLRQRTMAYLSDKTLPANWQRPIYCDAQLGDLAGVYGAADLASAII